MSRALTRSLDTSWVLVTAVACSVGVFAAWRATDIGVVLAVFMAGAAIGAAFVIPWVPTVSWRSRSLLVGGPGVGAASVVSLGLVRLIGVGTIAVLAVLVATAPSVRAAVAPLLAKLVDAPRPLSPARRVGVQPAGEVDRQVRLPALELEESFVVPDVMTDEDLCQAWRSSYVALSRATTVSSQLRVVQMRALYLDELERRAGPALQAWFHSGARAAGDPTRSLTAGDAG
jgi:hypothetical protein